MSKQCYNYVIIIFLTFIFISCNSPHVEDNLNSSQQIYKKNEYLIRDTLVDGIKFMSIPKGIYTYGIYDDLKTIDYDYWMMKYEVTNKEYIEFLNLAFKKKLFYKKDDTLLLSYSGDSIRQKGHYHMLILDNKITFTDNNFIVDSAYNQHPVTGLTWFGCKAFCDFHNFQLPSQYEWEKAARGATGWNYPWGDSLDFRRANYHFSHDPFEEGTTPVGFYNGQNYLGFQTIDSPSPYGCYDMAGNAWEVTNSTIFPDKGFIEGGGGGYLYHTGAMTQSWFRSRFGYPIPSRIDRAFISDGFRCLKR